MNINSPDYHDYVIKDGRLIGEFEQMYQKAASVPWHQDEQESWIDVRLTVEILRGTCAIERIVDYGCGLGCYLDILVRQLDAVGGGGSTFPKLPCKRPAKLIRDTSFSKQILPRRTLRRDYALLVKQG